MASQILVCLTTTLKQLLLKIPTEMHSYCSNNAVILLNVVKSLKI